MNRCAARLGRTIAALFAFALLNLPLTVLAAPMGYTDLSAWETAVAGSSIVSESFEESSKGNLLAGTTDLGAFSVTIDRQDPGPTFGTLNLTGVSDKFGSFDDFGFTGEISIEPFFLGVYAMSFEFDTPVIGFAARWSSVANAGDSLSLVINGSTVAFDDFLSDDGIHFFGVADSMQSFTRIDFFLEDTLEGVNGNIFGLDNALVATVPEPNTAVLLGFGLIGLAAKRSRRHSAPPV